MKYLILAIIKLYWLIPAKRRKECLFKESCSTYVYRITLEQGFLKGMIALRTRMKQCKPGYFKMIIDDTEMVVLSDKTAIPRSQTTI